MEEEREMCQNCKKDITVTNYRTHTLHCARNMVKCTECELMVGKENLELHRMEFHSLRICDQCQVSIEAFKLPEHKKTLCSKRKLICKYCGQPKMAMEMSDHETYCGSRTERCDRCPDWVPLREWDSHQSRYHSNVQRRFRERSVIAQTETVIDYNTANGKAQNNVENDKNANNTDPMLPCEFCDGLVPMRKLLEHQAACVNPTNVRRNDSSCNSSVHSSFRSQTRPQVQKKLSCAEKMALDSPESPQSPKKSERRKISAPATLDSRPGTSCTQLEEPTIQAEKTKVPCEFCNEPCSLEALMRHQRTCKKNPHISPQDLVDTPYTNGFRRQRHYSLSRTQSVRDSSEIERPLRALSRQNSFSDRSYLRRSESFYGSRTTMTLGRQSTYSSTDYASAVRRSSLFDGYAGYSIYTSISQGLDEITYGGRRSRRGSVSAVTAAETTTYSFSSRRGSVSNSNANAMDYAALMAATATLEATSKANQKKDESESGLGNSPKSINLSRQNSTRMSNMSDSAYGEDYESSGSPVTASNTMHKIQKSYSLRAPPVKKLSCTEAIKHSKSSGKLERKVSFSEASEPKIQEKTPEMPTEIAQPAKPKRSKDKKEKSLAKIKSKKDKNGKVSDAEFVDQVNAKLRVLEQQQQKSSAEVIEVIPHPNSMDISATIKLSPKSQRPKSQQNNPAIQSILQDLVSPGTESPPVRREKNTTSRIGSKRNSLDKQSVQTLAQDLAAECAKAYALMESSLSKLSNELGVTPFGLAPKNKKLRKSSSTTTASVRPQDATSTA